MAESATADSGNRYKYGSPKGQTDLDEKFSFGRQERIVPVRSCLSLYFVLQRAQTEIANKKDRNQILLVNENCFADSSYKVKGRYRAKPYTIPFLFAVIAKYSSGCG